jgi:hypothetical protein
LQGKFLFFSSNSSKSLSLSTVLHSSVFRFQNNSSFFYSLPWNCLFAELLQKKILPIEQDFFVIKCVYFTAINSTSKIKVAFGGITPPAPDAP